MTSFSVTSMASSVWIVFLIAGYLYSSFKLQRYYMFVSRELQRLESISTSPILQKFKEGLTGVTTIRFFQQREYQFNGYFEKVDLFQRNTIALRGLKNWFVVRVTLLSLCVIVPTIYISVSFNLILTKINSYSSRIKLWVCLACFSITL